MSSSVGVGGECSAIAMVFFFVPLAAALVLPAARAPAAGSMMRAPAARMVGGSVEIGDFPELDGSEVRVGILKARWHEETCDSLVAGIKEGLSTCNVKEENVLVTEVPGSFELPLAARYLALSGTVDAIIPVGVLIKGDTIHFEVISEAVTDGLMGVGLQTGIPVIFGVLTVMNEAQAKDRSTGKNNHGVHWGQAAVEMACLRQSALGKKKQMFMGFGQDDKDTSAVGGGATEWKRF